MIKLVNKLYWWLYICKLSFRWIFNLNIGDIVIYNGQEWEAVQGVCDPSWDFMRGEKRISLNKNKVIKKKSLINYIRSYKSGYRFYMQNWYSIWVRNGIEDWMRGCNIWAK